MWHITQLKAKEVLSWDKLVLEFSNNTVYSIVGENGSGKSSIFEIIKWVLFKKTTKKSIQPYWAKDAGYAELTLENESGVPIVIKRKVSTPATVYINDEENTQEHLEEIIGCSYLSFMSAVMCDQKRTSSFVNEKSGSGKSKIFGDMIGASVLDKMRDQAQKLKTSLEKDYISSKSIVDTLKTQVDELLLSFDDRSPKEMLEEVRKKESHLLRYQQRSKALSAELEAAMEVNRSWESYERNLEVTKNLRTELKSIRAKIEPLIQGLKSFKVSNYKKELEELREAARGLQAHYSEQQAEFLSAKSEYSKLQTLINEGGKCPTCSSQIHDPKTLKAASDKFQRIVRVLETDKSSTHESSTKIQRGIEEVELKIRDYEGRKSDIEQMKTVFNAKKASLDFIKIEEPSSARKDINQLREEANSVGEKGFEAQEFIQTQKALLRQFKSLREKLNEAKESLKAVEGKYLLVKWMFDNLPVMKLRFIDQNKVTVENLINEELSKMGLPFIVQIDTQRSLSKGTRIKDEFTFKIINVHSSKEAHHDDLSGGEEVCVLLATQFAINQVSRTNLGFEIYDEIYGPLDKGNKSIVIEGLKERARSKQVLSVSHDDEITHSFDTIISIFKVEGKSRVKGQVYGEE